MKSRMNKRGDISITLLVIGVFAICTLAIISFILQTQQINIIAKISQEHFANLELFENLSSQAEDFYFYANSGLSQEAAAERIGAQIQDNKLVLNAEQKDPDIILSVQYIIDLNS